MGNKFGTISRGVKAPIIREGDNLRKIVVDSVIEAATDEGVVLGEKDVVSITEAVVARAQGNYATVDQMAKDIKEKMDSQIVGVIFPILSRNRFSLLLKSMARGLDKIVLMLSYPSDEVGNELITME
ncbi:MAG: F420-0--gamma-glutamyl ligase, partial [Clostridium sp.]|nr:F420-0--gamma-glutamyl ligase [Clostridium sp.]